MIYKFIALTFCVFYSLTASSELTLQSLETVTDSEESFQRRTYSYDFDVSHEGVVHAVYAKPAIGRNRANIVYMSKKVGEKWPAENKRVILETDGRMGTISTNLIFDNAHNTVHISYIIERDFIDLNGVKHDTGLIYQKVVNGQVGEKISVSSGGYHTLMQLDENGRAIFIREYQVFLNSDGTFKTAPYPEALRIQLPLENNVWTDRLHILDLPPAEDYRLANFVYDTNKGRYHIAYGNKNADFLRKTYPTTNPPVHDLSKAVPFPPGAGHDLIYAFSDDLQTWHTSVVDNSGSISENEFWTDLIINEDKTHIVSFRYGTDAKGIQQGTSNIFATFAENTWDVMTVAGKTTGASTNRAGMGAKLLVDQVGGFHAFWDNSPDAPIDSESAKGTTMYRYSPDGKNWESRQVAFPFSDEGKIKAKLYNDRLLVMLLGDATDARVFFAEFKVPTSADELMEVSSDKMFYGLGEKINLYARLQGKKQSLSDLYLVVTGPYDKALSGELIPTLTTAFHFFGSDYNWHKISDLMETQAVLSNFMLTDFHGFFTQAVANKTTPFNKPGRYRFYNVATAAGSNLKVFDLLTPLYTYDIHVCNQLNCAEIVSQ
ncbi:MAG: hypothetical protein V3U87_18030 [Methylococcaceae bacterium]